MERILPFYRLFLRESQPLCWCILVLLANASCVRDSAAEPIGFVGGAKQSRRFSTIEDQLKRLERVAPLESENSAYVEDIRLILEAELAAERGTLQKSTDKWLRAMKASHGPLAKEAFVRWLSAIDRQSHGKSSSKVLAELILAKTNSGQASRFLSGRGLTSTMKLQEYLLRNHGELLSDAKVGGFEKGSGEMPLVLRKEDFLYRQFIRDACENNSSDFEIRNAVGKVDTAVSSYIRGAVEACRSNPRAAISALETALSGFAGNVMEDRLYSLEILRKLVILMRRNDRRKEASEAYLKLALLWQHSQISPINYRLPKPEFYQAKINELLWAARYRAIAGDYENGKKFAQLGLDIIDQVLRLPFAKLRKWRTEIAVLKAEAYHILAHRIAVEQKQYEQAVSLLKLSSQASFLPVTWKRRIQWYLGLYEHLAANYSSSSKHWEELLEDNGIGQSTRTRIHFWMAKNAKMLGKNDLASEYGNILVQEDPLSYYCVVALPQLGLSGVPSWRTAFQSPESLLQTLLKRSSYDLDELRENSKTGELLRKVEILVAANLTPFAEIMALELNRQVKAIKSLRVDSDTQVYLARLLFGSDRFIESIGLTTNLMSNVPNFWKIWPDQLHIYFPMPFIDAYVRESIKHNVDQSLLLAVSRQESGFNPAAKSGAGAYGVMQLILPTARAMAVGELVQEEDLEGLLVTADFNIGLGAKYLSKMMRRYGGRMDYAAAAYNAGPVAVDAWKERRAFKTSLHWIEMIPFGETKSYVRNVIRNYEVYEFLKNSSTPLSTQVSLLHPRNGKGQSVTPSKVYVEGKPSRLKSRGDEERL